MANVRPLYVDATKGHPTSVTDSDVILVGGIEGGASATAVGIFDDAFTTAITIGGGASQTTTTMGKAGQTTTNLGSLTVDEDLTVNGTTTTLSTTNLAVTDDLIILDKDAATADEAGIAIERGSTGDDALVLWNEANTRFELGLFDTSGGTVAPTGALTTYSNMKLNDLLLDGTAITADGALTVTATSANLDLAATGANAVEINTNGSLRWSVNSAGHLIAGADNSYDIGTGATDSPRTIRADTSVIVDPGGTSAVTLTNGDISAAGALTVTAGGSNTLTLEGFGTTYGLNASAVALTTTAQTIIEAINEVDAAAGAGNTWANTLSAGATSGGTSPSLSSGDDLTSVAELDITAAAGANAVTVTGGAGSASAGGSVDLVGGAGDAANAGGASSMTGGVGGATGAGGAIQITSGAGGGTSGNSGAVSIDAGSVTSGTVGSISIGAGTTGTATPTLNLASAAATQAVNLGTGAGAKTVTIGSTNSTSSVQIDSGTGNIDIGTGAQARSINIGTGAAAQTVVVGSNNTTSATTIDAGSGGMTLDSDGALTMTADGVVSLTADQADADATGHSISLTAGLGGAPSAGAGETGGAISATGGAGSTGATGSVGGTGGVASLTGGDGGNGGPTGFNNGGVGGDVSLTGGVGGDGNGASSINGDGGAVTITGGAGNSAGAGTTGDGGSVTINAGAGNTDGNISIGTADTNDIFIGNVTDANDIFLRTDSNGQITFNSDGAGVDVPVQSSADADGLTLASFTASSIIGAINENRTNIAGSNEWSEVLTAGNTSGANNPTIDTGQHLDGAAELSLRATGANEIQFTTNSTARWNISSDGHFIANTDNSIDIGASGATRPRRVYVGTEVVVGSTITIQSSEIDASGALTLDVAGVYALDAEDDSTVNVAGNLTVLLDETQAADSGTAGNAYSATSGIGAAAGATNVGGVGGAFDIAAGAGGVASASNNDGGAGGVVGLVGGAGGDGATGQTGGTGGAVTLTGGAGGGAGGGTAGAGGSITIIGGAGTTDGSINIGTSDTNQTIIGNTTDHDDLIMRTDSGGQITFQSQGAGSPVPMQASADTDGLTLTGFTATSIIGAINENQANIAASGNTLQQAYVAGNTISMSDAEGNFDVSVGSGTPAISLDAAGASNFTVASANLTLSTTTSGAIDVTSAGILDLDAAGALSLNSSGAAINIGDDAVAQAINIGTGAAARTVSLGTGAAAMTVNIGSTNSTSATTIDSGTGNIDIGTGAQARSVNVGTGGAAQTVTVGSQSGASSLTLDSGTGNIDIGTGGQARSINLGTGAAAQTVVIGSTNTTSSVQIDSGTGNIDVGTGAQARSVNIATGAAAQTVTMGSTTTTSATTIQAGASGDITFDALGMTTPITLNESGDLDLDATFTATSIIGALNELIGGGTLATFTAGAGGITANRMVYVSADNTVLHADASADATARVIGVAPAAISAASTGQIQLAGVASCFFSAGLTAIAANEPVWLSETAGEVTNVAPTASGSVRQLVGYIKDSSGYNNGAGSVHEVVLRFGERFENP